MTNINKNSGIKKVPNIPNAGKFIIAMQRTGYDTDAAICDIIDNSIDAGATEIHITTEEIKTNGKKDIKIRIIDNGCGMNYDTLDQALKFGSDTPHSDITDLGKFGMGLCTASLSIADITTVLTQTLNDEVYYSSTNVDEIISTNSFTKDIGFADNDMIKEFKKYVNSETGTMIILDHCSGLQTGINGLNSLIIESLSRVYRKLLLPDGNLKMFLNETMIEPLNFFVTKDVVAEDGTVMIESNSVIRYCDDDIPVKYINKEGITEESSIHIKLALIPYKIGNQTIEDKLGIGPNKQGWSIMRNNREIVNNFIPRTFKKKWGPLASRHPDYNRMKFELSFSSELDEAMGVNHQKNFISMTESIVDQIAGIIKGNFRTAKNQLNSIRAKNNDEVDINHNVATNIIKAKSNTLKHPSKAVIEKRNAKLNKSDTEKKPTVSTNNTRIGKETHTVDYKESNSKLPVVWGADSRGELDSLFASEMIGRTIKITYNTDHPFYQKFILMNKDNDEVLPFIDSFIYSMAMAKEIYLYNHEDLEYNMEELYSDISENLRKLVN